MEQLIERYISRISMKILIRCIASISLLILLLIFFIDTSISMSTQKQLITDTKNMQTYRVAVVLGTSKFLGKTLNDYYFYRIYSAISLYHKNKINYFLLSGDNAHRSYNEPITMWKDLIKGNIPADKIYLDYAGFRTLDSIIRAHKIFGIDDFLIISQKFHCERALFIARHHNINAHCYIASDPKEHLGITIRVREIFARIKAYFDIYIFDTQPKFLGEKEPIFNENF